MLKKFCLLSVIAFFLSCYAEAETYVVADTGKTIDLKSYMNRTEYEREVKRPAFTVDDAKIAIGGSFPLISSIPLGGGDAYEIDITLPANFALVGVGVESQRWLEARFADIQAASAIVIVIDAPDMAAYTKFENVLRRAGLTVTRSSSEPFEGVVKSYPALVANGRVTR